MSVSKEDREAYEKGLEDSKQGFFENLLDVQGSLVRMAEYSPSEHDAYDKGMSGERLDEDKKDD